MKLLLILFLLLQQPEIIKVSVGKSGQHDSVKMEYREFDNYKGFAALADGKYRFYIVSDENCRLQIINSKKHNVSSRELAAFNELLKNYRIEYRQENLLIADCAKFSGRRFPVTVTVRR